MRKSKKLVIIGHFGGNENILDGQTIKTKILYEELLKATDWKIKKVDTYYKNKNPGKVMFNTLIALFTIKNIIVLLSGNGMKIYFPLLYIFSKIFHTRVYHDVIGGNLDTYVRRIPRFRNYLNAFQFNWVETEMLKKKLEVNGIDNCQVIPNFKRLNCVNEYDLELPLTGKYRFCTFSRVMKEKGIEEAIKVIQIINREKGKDICTLDIYGPIDNEYKERFEKIMNRVSTTIKYCGKISYEKSVEVIKDYYALLFPTFWRGEGFPGTIVDAFSAGVPVIATAWNCNGEIIENGKNGILYPTSEIQTLKAAIEFMINNPNRVMIMKKNCIYSARKYQPEKYIEVIINSINNGVY